MNFSNLVSLDIWRDFYTKPQLHAYLAKNFWFTRWKMPLAVATKWGVRTQNFCKIIWAIPPKTQLFVAFIWGALHWLKWSIEKFWKSSCETDFNADYKLKVDKSSVNEKIRKFIRKRLYFAISCPCLYVGG